MNEVKRGPGRPSAKDKVVTNIPGEGITTNPTHIDTVVLAEETKPVTISPLYYNMYTDHIACGQPGNNEAAHSIKRPENGLISEVELIAAGVDIAWLKSAGILEPYGYLPTFN